MNIRNIPPLWLKALTSRYILWEYPGVEKKIYLTFDDGPHCGITPAVVEMLAAFDARATFFVNGQQALRNPHLMLQLQVAGHSVGNHGWGHADGWKTSTREYLQDARLCGEVVDSPLFRPPYGRLTPGQLQGLRKAGFRIVMWSLLTGDFDPGGDKQQMLARCLKTIGPGSIVVFHDSPKAARNCLFLLEKVLAHFSAEGFGFEAISVKTAGK